MHNLLKLRLHSSVIQRTFPGVTPPRVITSPEPCEPIYSMLSEDERLAQFAHSKDFHARRYAREQAPDSDYNDDLAEGFAQKYG